MNESWSAGARGDVMSESPWDGGRLRGELAFWGLLAALLGALVAPIWYGEMPPLTDFGGHVQLIHGYLGAEDPSSVWFGLVERAPWWQPNGAWVQVSALLYPWLSPLSALRALFTLTIIVGVLGQVKLLDTFTRSRWLVFLGLPIFVWHGMSALGFVNYTPTLALVPWVVVLARRAADRLSGSELALLTVLPVLAVWFHALGGLLVVGCGAFMLGVSARSLRRWARLWVFIPALAYWLGWFSTVEGLGGGPSRYDGWGTWLSTMFREPLRLFHHSADVVVMGVLVGLLLVAFVGGRLGRRAHEPQRWGWGWLNEHALLLLAVMLLIGYRILPRYRGDVALAERVLPTLVAVVWALPRPAKTRIGRWLVRGAVAGAVLAGVAFAAGLMRTTARFEREELGLALPLIDRIPWNSRAQCVAVQRVEPQFQRRPLDHGCDGVLAERRHAFAGGGFADTAHNAIRFKAGVGEHRIADSQWREESEFSLVDWVLVRGAHQPPSVKIAVRVGVVEDAGGPHWTLYRSLVADVSEIVSESAAGGSGGGAFRYQCPRGWGVVGLAARPTVEGETVAAVQVACLPLEGSARRRGAAWVLRPVSTTLREEVEQCAPGEELRGVVAYADDFVHGVTLECQPTVAGAMEVGQDVAGWWRGAVWRQMTKGLVGATRGRRVELRCPEGTDFVGLGGRSGLVVDQLSVRCARRGFDG